MIQQFSKLKKYDIKKKKANPQKKFKISGNVNSYVPLLCFKYMLSFLNLVVKVPVLSNRYQVTLFPEQYIQFKIYLQKQKSQVNKIQ